MVAATAHIRSRLHRLAGDPELAEGRRTNEVVESLFRDSRNEH